MARRVERWDGVFSKEIKKGGGMGQCRVLFTAGESAVSGGMGKRQGKLLFRLVEQGFGGPCG